MTTVNERQEKLAAEQAYKEHIHHTKINAAAVTDHVLANIHTFHVKLHQYHWYVKDTNFYSLHEVFEKLYNENETWFDKIAERLLASGFKPASTLPNSKNSQRFLKICLKNIILLRKWSYS